MWSLQLNTPIKVFYFYFLWWPYLNVFVMSGLCSWTVGLMYEFWISGSKLYQLMHTHLLLPKSKLKSGDADNDFSKESLENASTNCDSSLCD